MSANDTPPPVAAELHVGPVEVTPGVATDVVVQVTNRAEADCAFFLEVLGLEPEWTGGTVSLGPLAPGATGEATLRVHLPIGHPASQVVAAVIARPTVRFFDQSAPDRELRDAQADLILTVGDGTLIGAVLEPTEVRGAHRAHLDMVLHNRGKEPQRVDLRATVVDPGVTVEFRDRSHVLAPGAQVRVRTRLHGPRPFLGAPRRRPFGVRVQGRGTPVVLEGSFTQRPVLAGWLTKTVAIVAVVALWVTVAAVGVTALDKHVRNSATAKSVAGAPPVSVPAIPGAGSAVNAAKGHAKSALKPGSSPTSSGSSGSGPAPASGSASGSGASGSGASGSSGSGSSSGSGASGSSSGSGSGGSSSGPGSGGSSGGSSSGGSSSGGSSSGSGSGGSGGGTGSGSGGASSSSAGGGTTTEHANGAPSSGGGSSSNAKDSTTAPAKGARVSGKLTGTQPGGVTVSISPTSLVDENTQGANLTSTSTGGSGVTEAAKISSSAADTPIGKVYGEVAGASFNARLTAATTPQQTTTTAPDGSWAFAGLRAPGDYLVTFSRDGYQTSKYIVTTTSDTKPVTLAASLSPGTGAISGIVNGPSGPLGDADITISDGRITAATKTPTIGATGTWAVSGLNTPDTYLVTAKAPGYGAQTTLVTLAAGGTRKDVALTLSPGVGTITGTVTAAANGAGEGGLKVTASSGKTSLSATTTTVGVVGSYTLPNLVIPGTYTLTVSGQGWVSQTQQVKLTGNAVVNASLTPNAGDVNGVASSSTGGGLAGAGAILANDKNTFKTLTVSAAPVGGFDFGQVPAGQYVLTVEDFGYTTTSAEVTVTDGTTQTINLTLPFVGAASQNTATIQGSVSDVLNAKPIAGATLTLDGQSTVVATTGADGTYQIPNVAPGVHTVTAMAKGFESGSVQVSVTLGVVAFAPVIGLPIEDTVSGIVVSNAGGIVPDPSVQLLNPVTGAVIGSTTTPLSTPTATGIPSPAQGGFEIDDVPHGNYLMAITAPPANGCNTNAYVPAQISVTVALGTNLVLTGDLSPALDLAPSFNVITLEASASSLPTQVGGVAVTVTDTATGKATTCDSPAPPAGTGATPTDLTFPSLVAGDPYQATFTLTPTVTAPPVDFKGTLNNSSINTVVLSGPVLPSSANGIIQVSLEFPYRTVPESAAQATPPVAGGTIDCPVDTSGTVTQLTGPPPSSSTVCPGIPVLDLPTVQMTGTVGYNFPNPGQPTSPIQQTFTAQSMGNGLWDITAPDLLPSSVTFTISDGAGVFQQTSKTDNTSDPGFVAQSLLLNPTPAPAPIVTVSPDAGVTVTSSSDITGLSLTEAGGRVNWIDDASASPTSVEPGVYNLDFSKTGFDSATATVTVPLQTSLCPAGGCLATPVSVTLTPHVSLAVTPTFTPIAGLAYPTVTLTAAGVIIDAPVTLSPTNATATFTDLSVSNDNDYVVTIRAPGYQTCTQDLDLDAPASGGVQTCPALPTILIPSPPPSANLFATPIDGGTTDIDAPALNAEGYITGTLQGQINTAFSPLADVTLEATKNPGGPACASATSLVGSTNATGNFLLTGNYATADGGLCVGATYDVEPVGTVAGYNLSSMRTGVIQGGNNTANLTLIAGLIPVTITVEESSGKKVGGASIVAASAIGVQIGVPVSANPNPAMTGLDGLADLSISPTTYTFTVTAPGYTSTSIGPIPFAPGSGANEALTVVLVLDQNIIKGVVQLQKASGALQTIAGTTIDVSLANPNAPGTPLATVASPDGTYTFAAEPLATPPLTYIPDGNYIIEVNLPGKTGVPGYNSSPQVFPTSNSSSTPTVENSVLTADPATVNVSVSSTVPGTNLGGATVSLTPTTTLPATGACASATDPGTPQLLLAGQGVAQTATLVGSTVSFANVAPDYYTLAVTLTGDTVASQSNVIAVCPGTTTNPGVSIDQGSVSGTVNINSGIEDDPDLLDLTVTVGTTNATVSCLSLISCTYTAMVPDNATYTVTATLPGFTATPNSATLTTAKPTASGINLTLTPVSQNVNVTVTADTGNLMLSGATVTLTNPTTGTVFTATAKTGGNGQAEVTGVAPNPGAAYNVRAELDETFGGSTVKVIATGTVVVGTVTGSTAPATDIQATATGAFGQLSGSFTVNPTPAAAVPVSVAYCAATDTTCSAPIYGQALTSTQTYSAYLPAGSYFVGIDATASGYAAVAPAAATVTDGATTAATLPALVPTKHSVVVTFQSGGTPSLPVPTTATVSMTGPGGTYPGTADAGVAGGFDFASVVPDSTAYTVTATFDDVTVSGTVSVPVQVADPITQTVAGHFALVTGTVTLNPAPAAATTVNVAFCSDATCATAVAPTQTPSVDATGAAVPYSVYIPVPASPTADDIQFSATGYVTPTATAISLSDGQTLAVPLVTLQTPPPPPATPPPAG